MPWVRIDDQFPHHPKVVAVGPLGIAMQVAGLCYCSQFLTDGFIPSSAVVTLMDFSELDEQAFNGRGGVCWMAVDKLIQAGIWLPVTGGYQIHDYLTYQPSREQVLHEREANKVRQERFRGKKDITPPRNADVTPLVTGMSRDANDVNTGAPIPIPIPIPKELSKDNSPSLLTAPEWYTVLTEIPSFKRPVELALAWFIKQNISQEHAEKTAYSLKAKWPPSKTHKDVWATFQDWVKSPPLEQRSPNGTAKGYSQKNPDRAGARFNNAHDKYVEAQKTDIG